MISLVEAWNKKTGEKYPYLVPEHWFDAGLAGSLVRSLDEAKPADVETTADKKKGKTNA